MYGMCGVYVACVCVWHLCGVHGVYMVCQGFIDVMYLCGYCKCCMCIVILVYASCVYAPHVCLCVSLYGVCVVYVVHVWFCSVAFGWSLCSISVVYVLCVVSVCYIRMDSCEVFFVYVVSV